MRTTLALVVAAIGVAGCQSSFDTMRAEWPSKLKGKPIQEAVKRFGYPQSEQTILGDKVYTWSTTQSHVSLTPTAATTVGSVPLQATTVSYAATPATLACEVKIATGPDNLIKTLQYDGNNAACQPFADAMRRE